MRKSNVGARPYEMKGRQEARLPILDFEDIGRWRISVQRGHARLCRTREQRVIGNYSGKVEYRTDADQKICFRVEALSPILLKKEWDCVNLWNIGPRWLWEQGPTLNHSLILRDAKGTERIIPFVQEWLWPDMCYRYWNLDHIKLPDRINRPVTLIGMAFSGEGKPDTEFDIFLGPLYAYREVLKPLALKPLPDKLPFPVRDETILPVNKTTQYTNSVVKSARGYRFRYQAEDAAITYEVDIRHPIGGISVLTKGRRKAVDAGAQVVFENQPAVRWKLLRKRLAGGTLHLHYEATGKSQRFRFDCSYTIRQKSLIWTIEELSQTGHVEEIQLGKTGVIRDGRLTPIPMLCYTPFSNNSYTPDRPELLYADGLFYMTMFDWYYSDASMFFGGTREIQDGWAAYNGGVRYLPLINKVRNPVRERLFITVSPDVQEVFPTVPNPPSPMRSNQADRLWATNTGSDLKKLRQYVADLRFQGLEKVSIRYHEEFWREDGESFTFRLQPNPRLGIERIRKFVRFVKAHDWRVGLYSNYMDLAPVNALWNEDWVRRSHLGGWGPAWCRCYAPKAAIGWEQEAIFAPQIQKLFGTNFSYCDVETCISPMNRVDYDYRAPGAGKFRTVFEYIGLTVMNERRAYQGPVYSEGGAHWFYAGLVDGNYANMDKTLPVFPDFQLLKIHPLEMDGMSHVSGEAYVPYALAFGMIGVLYGGGRDAVRRYAFLQPLQNSYSMVPVRKIAYHDGKAYVTSSEAVMRDLIAAPRIHIHYESGLRVYVNLSGDAWPVRARGTTHILPTNGFLAYLPGEKLFACSVINRSASIARRLDKVYSNELHYLDTYGETIHGDLLGGKGAFMIKKEKFAWEIIPLGDTEIIDFDLALIGMENLGVDIKAVDKNGDTLDIVNAMPMRNRVSLEHHPDYPKYQICPVVSG